jgi:hypothetical protein
MAISVLAVHPNPPIPPSLGLGGMRVLSGVIECVFKGAPSGDVTRDTLTFDVGRVNLGTGIAPVAACIVSLASFAFDGPASNLLWAVDGARAVSFVNLDSGSGTADVRIVADLAVRGLNGLVLRVNYIVFQFPS